MPFSHYDSKFKGQDHPDPQNDIPRSLKLQMPRLGREMQSLSTREVLKLLWLRTTADMDAS